METNFPPKQAVLEFTPTAFSESESPSTPLTELAKLATQMRMDAIEMLAEAGSGHPGTSLSMSEIVACLYFELMNHDPKNPEDPNRDKFILSKGHGVPTLYSALARSGYFPVDDLNSLRKLNSPLQGHPVRGTLPGIEACTGSLGQGLSIAQGVAMADKLDGRDSITYCMIGDGETQEGQIWEAALSAPKFKLDNLIVITDYNKAQIDGYVEDVMSLESLKDKWEAFNWDVIEIDGHHIQQILNAVMFAKKNKNGKPTQIIAHTVKGKGVSFMEYQVDWHGVTPNAEQAKTALKELQSTLDNLN